MENVIIKAKPIQEWGRSWAFVTGASRGIGVAICERLANEFPTNSVIVGIARNKDGLQRTENIINLSSKGITFIPYSINLESATENDYSLMIQHVFEKINDKNFDRFLIVHNAGTLGELNYLTDITDTEQIKNYLAFNVCSVISLNGCLIKYLRKLPGNPATHVVNISSLAAVQPIKSWGLYSIGKAARNMAMTVLAAEEDIITLNYAPGAIETNMQVQARADTSDPTVRKLFQDMKSEGTLVKMEDSVDKLIRILKRGNFTSGAHIDYFDGI